MPNSSDYIITTVITMIIVTVCLPAPRRTKAPVVLSTAQMHWEKINRGTLACLSFHTVTVSEPGREAKPVNSSC